ncbi:unnamed protein product [Prunus armeniaca]
MLMALGQQVTQMEVWESWCVILTVILLREERCMWTMSSQLYRLKQWQLVKEEFWRWKGILLMSPIGPVVEDTKTLLTHITRDGFTHIRRVANGAAHRLAWYASHIGTTTTWFEEPPDLPILSFS